MIAFLIAVGISLLWSGYISWELYTASELTLAKFLPIEIIRSASWFGYLLVLITCIRHENSYLFLSQSKYTRGLIFFTVFALVIELVPFLYITFSQIVGMDIRILFHVILAIIGLTLVEQLYRNSPSYHRWSVKFIFLGLGGVFVLDFVLYSKALLFAEIDPLMWNVRGIVNTLIIPMLGIAIFRIKNQTKRFHLSRKMIFHTVALTVTGFYLILMSFAGFYIKYLGGSWGEMVQTVFIFAALGMLLVLLFSGKVRAIAKVFINKHFVRDRYDYRECWLKISSTLAEIDSMSELYPFIITTLADLVDVSGGGLWIKNEEGHFHFAFNYKYGFNENKLILSDDELIGFLEKHQWVIDVIEYQKDPDVYDSINLTPWIEKDKNNWLIVPLYQNKMLHGFVVLSKPRLYRKLNWEDFDMLKMVGMQLTNAVVLIQSIEKLSIAKQFEAYNRLSAFVVHDLKNVMAQIGLIVKNAEMHKHNPEFIDDAIDTMENSVNKMGNLVRQLKYGEDWLPKQRVELVNLFKEIVEQPTKRKTKPNIKSRVEECFILAEKEKISSIMVHLIQNAQDATDDETGHIQVEIEKAEGMANISIIDNGVGMDEKFIYERLFKPFDTTKGNAGMGIGVYEAREYIHEHGGSINVSSKVGQGTTFYIRFPLLAS